MSRDEVHLVARVVEVAGSRPHEDVHLGQLSGIDFEVRREAAAGDARRSGDMMAELERFESPDFWLDVDAVSGAQIPVYTPCPAGCQEVAGLPGIRRAGPASRPGSASAISASGAEPLREALSTWSVSPITPGIASVTREPGQDRTLGRNLALRARMSRA